MQNKLIQLILGIAAIMLVVNVVHTWINLEKRGDIVKETAGRLEKSKQQKENLERELARVQSQEYIEKEARDKLNLGREGEVVLLLPTISTNQGPTPTPLQDVPNWQRWWKLFF